MKKNIFGLLIFCFFACNIIASDKHVLYLDIGGYRGNYIYPTMNLGYTSAGLFNTEGLKLNIRIRSYGTWYLVSLKNYDFTLIAEYYFPSFEADFLNMRLFFGAGANGRLRLYNEGTNSVEPVAEAGAVIEPGDWSFKLPIRTTVYSDGISFTVMPEFGYKWGNIGVFYRTEVTFLQRFDRPLNDWYWNNFIGVKMYFY